MMITSAFSRAEYFTNVWHPDTQIHMVPSNTAVQVKNSPYQTPLQQTRNCFSPQSSVVLCEMGLISSTEVTRYHLAMSLS